MRILVVDDDDFILELLPKIIAKLGSHDVSGARTGETALDLIVSASPPFDCLLVDIQMDGMDGIELCRRIKLRPEYRRTPVIMLTAMTDKNFIERAFGAGATDYATKPFDRVELGARLRMAQELVEARREAMTKRPPPLSFVSSRTALDVAVLVDEVRLHGVRNLVDLASLRNYLAQLSRAALASSQIFGVKVDGIGAINGRGNVADTIFALTETAEAVAQAISVYGYLMAYAGSGCFICSCNRPSLIVPEDLESDIESVVDDRDATYDNGDQVDITVSVGYPIRPRETTPARIKDLFAKVISRVERRAEEKRNAPRVPGFRRLDGP